MKEIERDVFVPLTGRRQSGKDTVASLAIQKCGAVGRVALSDWFKKMLAEHFKFPLLDFYGPEKDWEFEEPIIIKRSDVSRLLSKTSQLAGPLVDARYQKISVMKWEGRMIRSIRDLMIWWAHEVVTTNLGERTHNEITAQVLKDVPRKDGRRFNCILITDARQLGQSSWFRERYQNVYPIKIVRPDGTLDQSAPEKMTDEFPEGYFYDTIINDGSIEDLEGKVRRVFGRIYADLKGKIHGRVSATETETKEETKP